MVDIGEMLDYIKDVDDVTLEDLSAGICSRSYLSRVMKGDYELKGIFFFYIMKRLYVAPDRFFILIDKKEYEYFCWLHQCQQLIAEQKYMELSQKLEEDNPEKRFRTFNTIVQHDAAYFRYIVEREIRKDNREALLQIKKAVDFMFTKDGAEILRYGRYSTEELNRFMNYLDLMIEMGKISVEIAKGSFEQIRQMAAFSQRDPREKSRLYPRITCFTLHSVGITYVFEIWKALIEETLIILRGTTHCYDMPCLLQYLCKACSELEDPEISRYQKWYSAICTVYGEGEYAVDFNRYNACDSRNQLFLIHEYLRKKRLFSKNTFGKTYSQEEISYNIIEQSHYSRIETGITRPRRRHFVELTDRMRISSDMYQGEIITPYITDFYLITTIRQAIIRNDIKALTDDYSVLYGHLDRSYTVNAQFLDQIMVNIRLIKKEITEKEATSLWEDILGYTKPYKANKEVLYSHIEINLIYKIARSKYMCGTASEKDAEILESVPLSEEASSISSWDRIKLIKCLLATMMYSFGKLEKAGELFRECIREMMTEQDAGLMIECVNNLSECIIEANVEKARKLMQAANWICDLYQKDKIKETVKETFNLYFGTYPE